MLAHLLNLLTRAFMAIPSSLGSNWLGLVFPVLAVLVGEGIAWWVWGLAVVKANWTKATGIGFAALGIMYTLLFMWCIVTTTYGDHVGLANRVGVLRGVVNRDALDKLAAVGEVRQELTDVKQDCAEIQGERQSLDNQTKVQQATINNCQTQALKLLTQDPLVITKLPIYPDTEHQGPGIHKVHVLLLTNKTIPTVRLKVFCNRAITSAHGELVGGNMLSSGVTINPENVAYIAIDSPSWTPTRPLLIDMTYIAPKNDLACNVEQN